MNFLDSIRFDERGLVPAIAQDALSGTVLMLAYMNEESLRLTISTGYCHYFSRSRQSLWKKGETSGHVQKLCAMSYDCDGDTILLKVEQSGPACHTNAYSCFFNDVEVGNDTPPASFEVLLQEYATICDRREHPVEGSYTNYLFNKGIDKMCKKVGEESAEVIIAAKNEDPKELTYEVADLLFHTMVVMAQTGVEWTDILQEVRGRMK